MTFLEHVMSNEGIRVDSAKVEAIHGWPRPTSLLEIQSFVRLAG